MQLRPVEDDFAGTAAVHRLKALFKIAHVEMMRDNRRNIESALKHRGHLIPRLEHLASVDAADVEAAEYNGLPVDLHILFRNAEHGDSSAVFHIVDHLIEGSGTIYGMYVIEGLNQTKTEFFRDGMPRRIEFTLSLKRVDESLSDMFGDLSAQLNNLQDTATSALSDISKTVGGLLS